MPAKERQRKKDDDVPIGRIVFFGKKVTGRQRDSLVRASISLTYDQVSQIQFDMIDPGFNELDSGIYTPGIPVRYESELMTEIASVEVSSESGQPLIVVKCRPRVVRRLKKRRGKKTMSNVSPTEFVASECRAVGAKFVGQQSPKRKQIARDHKKSKDQEEPPSSWTTAKRLAGECGFVLFEANNTVYFGKPTWFLERFDKDALEVNWDRGGFDTRPISIPRCSRSEDAKDEEVSISFEMNWSKHARKFRPGKAIKLRGIPTYNGTYLIKSVDYSLLDPNSISVTAGTPIDPEKIARPAPKKKKPAKGSGGDGGGSGGSGGSSGGGGGRKSAGLFVTNALRQAGDAYIYGAEASTSNANPGAFDCSELVQWAAARAGVYIPDGSSAQIAFCRRISVAQAIRTRGALLWHPGHIAISLGNGRTIEAANPGFGVGSITASGRFSAGGLIPGMRY